MVTVDSIGQVFVVDDTAVPSGCFELIRFNKFSAWGYVVDADFYLPCYEFNEPMIVCVSLAKLQLLEHKSPVPF